MVTYADWVHRRVEQISFPDDESVERRVSVDFTLPATYAGASLDRWYVPLGLLDKRILLVDFDLRDEEGGALPLTASSEAHRIGAAMLVAAASAILADKQRSLSSELAADLQRIPTCKHDEAKEAVRSALTPRRGGDDRSFLARDPLIAPLARDLSESFLVLSPLSTPDARRVFKFSYLQFWVDGERRWGVKLANALGWTALRFKIYTPGAAMARSYHCEITAPERLEITHGELVELRDGGEPKTAQASASRGRIHFWLDDVRSSSTSVLKAHLRARRRGLPGMAAILSLGISLLLTTGVIFLEPLLKSKDIGPALLVAIPALLAAYLSAPGEHRLASKLLVGIRWLMGLVALMVFIAAASLTGSNDHEATVWVVWLVATGLCWIVTGALLVSFLLPRAGLPPGAGG
jgi:hypothetical protein